MAQMRVNALPTHKTYAEARTAMVELIKQYNMNVGLINTHYNTELTTVEALDTYVSRMTKTKAAGEKSAIVNEYLTKALKKMSPMMESYWLMSKTVYEKCYGWFDREESKKIVDLAKVSSQKADCTLAELNVYLEAAKAFRLHCDDVLDSQSVGFQNLDRDVETEFAVPTSQAVTVNEILTSIIYKRNESLGGSTNTTGGTPSHYNQFLTLLETGQHIGAIDVMARRASGSGLFMNSEGQFHF